MLEHLRAHLTGKVVILGIGNTLRGDDAVGSLLAGRIKDKLPYIVYDAGPSPENYLGKIIKDKPDSVVIVDAADIGQNPGEVSLFEPQDIKVANLFSTHNSSISLVINYLQSHLTTDIIILIIQPASTGLGEGLTAPVKEALERLERWFYEHCQKKG